MAFMTDKNYVIGDSTPKGNEARFKQLPPLLTEAMRELYDTDNIAVGAASLGQMIRARKNRYVLTENPEYKAPEGFENILICRDFRELVDLYEESPEELLIAGGRSVFLQFLPYASILDVAEADKPVPGDLVFDQWKKEPFKAKSSKRWEGFNTTRYIRF